MRIAIVQFPGSNCERETMLAVKRAGMEPVEFLWNEPKEKLRSMDGYIIVGGFSYEDRSRAGIIAALDPVMHEIKAQSEMGKPILGICNGAQVLVETGLVPGLENNKIGMVLTENKRVSHGKILGTGYYNAWVHMRLSDNYQRNAFTQSLNPTDILHVPVAHGEGRFVMTEALLAEVKMQGLNVFQYCDASGNIIDSFPTNPNGSIDNIAAISNKAGNVMAMMPHPERTLNGDAIFHSMRHYLSGAKTKVREENAATYQYPRHTSANESIHNVEMTPLYYYPRRTDIPAYKSVNGECIVELIITDNHALTVQNTLRQRGLPVTVKRKIHWEIQCDSSEIMQQIKKSGVLFNERKEVELSVKAAKQESTKTILVRAKEDIVGLQKLQMLKDHFFIQGLQHIKHGILWQFTSEDANITDLMDPILNTNIIFNPYAHDCYQY